jgi:aromatic ring-opening dioxygenase catalytic subunit (LigB family)
VSFPGNARVAVIATGGMSHQIAGTRFGIANEEWDRTFLQRIEKDVDKLVAIPQEEIMKVGGTEAAELAIWFAMRGALSDNLRRVHDFYTFPQITGCGVVVFDDLAA